MSNALAISAVTGVLQYMLNQVYNHPSSVVGNVTVSAVAPDIVQSIVGTGTNAPLQVNLFLHQVTLNPAWRNMGLPSLSPDGTTALNNPPLALDLHYLLTTYAAADGQAEALLSYAIFLLHQNPVLSRSQIKAALAALPPTYSATFAAALSNSGLADQVEMLTITPATLGREEIAWLWTALRVDYRPSYPFRVSVVLIEPSLSIASALPVLQRDISAQSGMLSSFPTISSVTPPGNQLAAVLGDTITIQGTNLANVIGVVLVNSVFGIEQPIGLLPGPDSSSFKFTIPNPTLPAPQPTPADLPAGVYMLSAQVPAASGPAATLVTNSLPLAIGPRILPTWTPGTLAAGQSVAVQVPCTPYLRVGQRVFLLIGSQQAAADAFTTPTNTPTFTFASLQSTGHAVPVRLRVDGLDSPILDMTQTPAVFTGPAVEVN